MVSNGILALSERRRQPLFPLHGVVFSFCVTVYPGMPSARSNEWDSPNDHVFSS